MHTTNAHAHNRKQSTKVLRELIQMTMMTENRKIFRASRNIQIGATRLSALPSVVTNNARVSSRP